VAVQAFVSPKVRNLKSVKNGLKALYEFFALKRLGRRGLLGSARTADAGGDVVVIIIESCARAPSIPQRIRALATIPGYLRRRMSQGASADAIPRS
jgi:hypothetical protein